MLINTIIDEVSKLLGLSKTSDRLPSSSNIFFSISSYIMKPIKNETKTKDIDVDIFISLLFSILRMIVMVDGIDKLHN